MSDHTITMSQEEYIKLLQQPLITELKGVNKNIDSKFSTLNDKIDDTEGRNKALLEKHETRVCKLETRMDKNDIKTSILWAAAGVLFSGLVALFIWLLKMSLGG